MKNPGQTTQVSSRIALTDNGEVSTETGLPLDDPACHTDSMRLYGQRHCPIARASEIFAERWTPIIVRNLTLGRSTFGQLLDGAPGISRTLLTQRLRELERLGLLERKPNPKGHGSLYRLTDAGEGLREVCDALGTWGARWLDVAPAELDPGTVLWSVARSMKSDRLPDDRVVVRFDISDYPKRYWLLIQQQAAELCRKDPGFNEDLIVTTDKACLASWHMGRISLQEASGRGLITIAGTPRLVRAFSAWGGQTRFAQVRQMTP